MNTKAQVHTIASLRDAAENAEIRLLLLDKAASYNERDAAKAELRKAREALRVFCYRSKTSLTASGRALRH